MSVIIPIAQRRDTAANWTAANPILLDGQLGFETDSRKFKLGNGADAWSVLQYVTSDPLTTVLTGITVLTGSITAADTIFSAFRKIMNFMATVVPAAIGDITTATDNVKYLTSSSWAWIKSQPAQWILSAFAGTGNRLMQVSSTGAVSATEVIDDLYETDADIITAITTAVYTRYNSYTTSITPASSKIFYEGKRYRVGTYLYMAISNNVVLRIGNFPIVEQSANVTMLVDTEYVPDHATNRVAFTLPSAPEVGDIVGVTGRGAGEWEILQNTGDTVKKGSVSTTAGVTGKIQSTNQYDNIEMECLFNGGGAGNIWSVMAVNGSPTFV